VIDLAAAGRLVPVGQKLMAQAARDDVVRRLPDIVELVIGAAAVRASVASWRHSWSGSAELVGRDGQPLDLEQVAALALQAETAGRARERLAALGIPTGHIV
jgi:hypothetical protein